MLINHSTQPKFSGLICHNEGNRRCPESGVRIFKYELTNNTKTYPLGSVVCPQSEMSELSHHPAVGAISAKLPELAKLSKEERLVLVRNLIQEDSRHWDIGKNKPDDAAPERLTDRGERLLQQSTADMIKNPNGSLSMIMDYDLDLKGVSLTALLKQKKSDNASKLNLLA